jgi:hypothetical protein
MPALQQASTQLTRCSAGLYWPHVTAYSAGGAALRSCVKFRANTACKIRATAQYWPSVYCMPCTLSLLCARHNLPAAAGQAMRHAASLLLNLSALACSSCRCHSTLQASVQNHCLHLPHSVVALLGSAVVCANSPPCLHLLQIFREALLCELRSTDVFNCLPRQPALDQHES